jgi:mono/diheme cytochrome c family protein
MKKITLTVSAAIMILAACKTPGKTTDSSGTTTKPTMDCGTPAPTYAKDIKAIIGANCIKCHGIDEIKGGYNLGKLDDLKKAGGNGDLLGTVKWQSGYPKMPAHAEQLDAPTIKKIECWINGGMPMQ